MKKLILISISISVSILLFAQNKIELKNGYTIKKATLFQTGESWIEYEKDGSLHDLLINDIHKIYEGDTIIQFDENNKAIYYNKYMIPLEKDKTKTNHELNEAYSLPDSLPTEKKIEQKPSKKIVHNKKPEKNTVSSKQLRHAYLFSPLALLETDPNLKFTGEFQYSSQVYFSQSLGLCFNNPVSLNSMLNNEEIKFGFILNSEIKIYLKNQKKANARGYQAFEIMCKLVKYEDTYNHYVESESEEYWDTPEVYYQNFEFTKNKCIVTSSYKLGKQYRHKNFITDLYVGMGFRLNSVKSKELNYELYGKPINKNDFYENLRQTPLPTIKAGIRIGFGA